MLRLPTSSMGLASLQNSGGKLVYCMCRIFISHSIQGLTYRCIARVVRHGAAGQGLCNANNGVWKLLVTCRYVRRSTGPLWVKDVPVLSTERSVGLTASAAATTAAKKAALSNNMAAVWLRPVWKRQLTIATVGKTRKAEREVDQMWARTRGMLTKTGESWALVCCTAINWRLSCR